MSAAPIAGARVWAHLDHHRQRHQQRRRWRSWRTPGVEDLVQGTYIRVLARPRLLRHADDVGYLLWVLRKTVLSKRRTARKAPCQREGRFTSSLFRGRSWTASRAAWDSPGGRRSWRREPSARQADASCAFRLLPFGLSLRT